MQELLKNCGFEAANTLRRDPDPNALYKYWIDMPQEVRDVLTPFITSSYVLAPPVPLPPCSYPIFRIQMGHATWLRQLTLDLLGKCTGGNTVFVFDVCKRFIRRQDLAIPTFLLPYITMNIILRDSGPHRMKIASEFLHVLSQPLPEGNQAARESLVSCSQVRYRAFSWKICLLALDDLQSDGLLLSLDIREEKADSFSFWIRCPKRSTRSRF